MSLNRSRPRVLARDISAADPSALPDNAMSTNLCLRDSSTFGSVPQFRNREGSHSTSLGSFAQCGAAGFMWTNTQHVERRRSALPHGSQGFRTDHKDQWAAVSGLPFASLISLAQTLSTALTTAAGIGTKSSSSAILLPLAYAQAKNLSASLAAAGSCGCLWIRMNVAAVIGHDWAAGRLGRIPQYPRTELQSAFAAAAWNVSETGATFLPSLLIILAKLSLFCLA